MIVLDIKEMSCNHCVDRIHTVLEEAGIKHEIKLSDKTVTVFEESQVEQAIEELDDIGFTAVVKN